MSFVIAGNSASTGYNLTRSLRFRASASGYLNRTPASSANGTKFTYSVWLKRGTIGLIAQEMLFAYSGSLNRTLFALTDDNIAFYQYVNNTYPIFIFTNAVYRDPSAWYHIVLAYDSTQATASNRVKLYINNVQVTSFSSATYPSLNYVSEINTATPHAIGRDTFSGASNFDGYMAEVNFIDGQALTPSSFGSTNALTGVWQPARYTGTYGTNGFYLPFTDNSALTTSSNVGLGKDFSGNGNYWATNNISITAGVTYDSMTDVPTLTSATAANFGVMNPIGNGSGTISNGNLRAVTSTTLADVGTFAMQSGKWYWEVTLTVSSNPRVGMYDIGKALPTAVGMGGTNSWAIINGPSRLYYQGTIVAYGSFVGSSGSVVMIAYDPTNGNLWFGENGSWFASGNPATGASPSLTGVTGTAIVAAAGSGSGSNTFDYNFGQQPFTYTPPTGFVALNTYNLPTSTIVKGNTVMDATLWAGTDVTPQAITNAAAFKPDLVWVKNRTTSGYWNVWFDSVRGVGNQLSSNQTDAELASASNVAGKVSAFNSNGFSLSAGSSSSSSVNGIGGNYVGWQWQAGQGSSSSNTNGSITSTVSVNASAGFSVATFTMPTSGVSTFGHGLGVAPQLVILKARTGSIGWGVYHVSVGNGGYLQLNNTSATAVDANAWNNTSPTSSVFTIGTSFNNLGTYVGYCWTPIAGFSAFGSYTGNGSADGTFVYTGFRPKFMLIKRTDAAGYSWFVIDTSLNPYNNSANYQIADDASAQHTDNGFDILSNGFKLRNTGASENANGGTYIYAAWAENPFKNSLAR